MEQSTNLSTDYDLRIDGTRITPNQSAKILIYSNYVVAALGVPGNTLVIIAVLLSKRVRNVSSAFIVNLSMADLITCLSAPVFSYVQYHDNYESKLEPICQALMVVVHTCIGASMYSLAFIAICRFLLITSNTTFYKAVYRTKYISLQIILIWVIPMTVAILPSFGIGQLGYDFTLHTCAPVKDNPTTSTYNNILTFILYPGPLCIIIFCYSGVLIKVKRHHKEMARLNIRRNVNITTNRGGQRTEMEEDDKKSSQSQSTSYSRLEIQISKNLFIIFLAYILCLTPQSLCNVISCRIDENYTRHVVLFNSILNPFSYGFKHPLFREVFIAILRCRQVPEPSSFLRAIIRTFKSH